MQEGRFSDYRFERKFVTNMMDHKGLELLVKTHPAMFTEIFWERQVNNIYFDTPALTYFFDNVVGKSQRRKVRIRWYGETNGLVEKPVLEFKVKSGMLGKKASFDLIPFNHNEIARLDFLEDIFRRSKIPDNILEELKGLKPSLLNRYRRRYYRSADHNYRFTIDYDLRYFDFSGVSIAMGIGKKDLHNTILELKYDQAHDDEAMEVTQHLPMRLSKSSKYVNGIDIVRNFLAV